MGTDNITLSELETRVSVVDRVQVPGGMWKQADIIIRAGGISYREKVEREKEERILPLPIGSLVQGAGIGVRRYIGTGESKK